MGLDGLRTALRALEGCKAKLCHMTGPNETGVDEACRCASNPEAARQFMRMVWAFLEDPAAKPELQRPRTFLGTLAAELVARPARDAFAEWLNERVALGGDQRILASALWQDFDCWCATHNAQQGTQAAFGARLQAMGVHLAGKDRRGRVLRRGCALKRDTH